MAPEATQDSNHVNPSSQVAALNTPSLFVNKVSSIPLISYGFDVAKYLYDGTKEKYQVVEKVEKGLVENFVPHVVSVTTKASQATPAIVTKGLTQLDSFACNSLDLLEQRVPLIREHPSQIAHAVTDRVNEGVNVIDQLVEKALVFSEEQIDYMLPEQAPAAVTATTTEQEQTQPPNKKQRLRTISRAHNIGINLTKRISHKAQQQLVNQKYLSIEAINFASAMVEKQLGRLKVNFEAVVNMIHEEDVHLRKLFDTYSTELRASFASALETIEKMSHGTVLETTLGVLDGLSKSISHFVTNTSHALQQLSEKTNDPILKKVLEGAFSSLNYIQEYSQYLGKFAVHKKPIVRTVNETVYSESVPETSSS